jgi:hypothetical protein
MAKSKSTNSLPPRDVIANRVEAQRKRVWQARAMCSIASKAAQELGGTQAESFSQDAWLALEGVAELLDDIASNLEGEVVLAQPKLGEGIEEEARS